MSRSACLMGCSTSTGNRGVSALAASLVAAIIHAVPDMRIYLLVGAKGAGRHRVYVGGRCVDVEIVNYRLSPRSRLSQHICWILCLSLLCRVVPLSRLRKRIAAGNRWLHILESADFVGDIRGGDSSSDLYGMARFVVGSMPTVSAALLRRDVVLLPQTYGPYRRPLSRVVARFLFGRARAIVTRDRSNLSLISSMTPVGIRRPKVMFCPDVAFTLEARDPVGMRVLPPLVPDSSRGMIVGLNVSGLLYSGGYSRSNMFGLNFDYRRFVDLLVRSILENRGVEILLIPHTYGPAGSVNSDNHAIELVLSALSSLGNGRLHALQSEHDQHELKAIIGMCDAFVGSRMHACIAAISQGIPTYGVAYSDKFAGVFDSVGLSHTVIDARKCTIDQAVKRILSGIGRGDSSEMAGQAELDSVRKEVLRVISELVAPR